MLNNATLKMKRAEVFTSMCPLCYFNASFEDSDTKHCIQLKLPLQTAIRWAGRLWDVENGLSHAVNITFVVRLQLM